jgi:hypothetical protein
LLYGSNFNVKSDLTDVLQKRATKRKTPAQAQKKVRPQEIETQENLQHQIRGFLI